MVFSSVPVYNWNLQHANQQTTGLNFTSDSVQSPPLLPPQPPTAGGGSGGGSAGSGPGTIRPGSMVDRARLARIPLPEAGQKCPRCESTNTKFCYFNNYSLSQPRHFCKTCRRYWTRGGALRNVPLGGGCRRNKRGKRGDRNRSKSPVSGQRRGASASTCSNIVSSCNNTSANDMSSQVLVPPQPQLPFLPGLHHLSGYVNDFGLNLGGGSGGGEAAFQVPTASSSGVQQFPDLIAGSDVTATGFYPFQDSELDHGSGLGQVTRVKMEGNQGLNLSKNLLGNQGNDDQFSMWGVGNAWTDPTSFHSSSSAGHLL